MMDVKPLRNEQDYDWAMREVAHYFEVDPELGTADGDRFEVLSILIKEYEDKHFRRRTATEWTLSVSRLSLWANRKPSLPP